MQKYTITIEPPESEFAPMYSAHCKEWKFVAEDKTPERALISLLDAVRIAEESQKKEAGKFKKEITFQIPAFS